MKKTFIYSAISQAVLLAIAVPAMAEESVNNKAEALDTIEVIGSGSMFRMGEVPFHQAKSAVAITREDLDKQDVRKADEIGRYQAGFVNQVFGNDTNTNWFRVRGAEVSQAVDGLPAFSYGFFTPYVETFGLEAVEVTKGADAMTFGAGNAGGLVNYVSKRAHKEQVGKGEFKVNMGNKTQYGFGGDYTGAMNADQSLRYRTVISYNAKDGDWDLTKNETLYVAPSIQWDITDHTRLDILASYQRDHGVPSSNFLPQDGSLVPTANGYISQNTNLGDPVNDTETNRQYSIGYNLEHNFGNGLSLNSSYRYTHSDNFHRGSYAYPANSVEVSPNVWASRSFTESNGSLQRGTVFNDGKAITHTLDNHITWETKNDWFKNTLVVGTDYRHQKVDALYTLFGSTAATNVFNSTVGYNKAQTGVVPVYYAKMRQLGFYLQNQTRLADQFVLGFGVRHDRVKNQAENSVWGETFSRDRVLREKHTSYSGSFMYESPIGLNPYFAYSESFNVPAGLNSDGVFYKPQITHQYEAGVKYIPTWLDGTISVAGFQAKDRGTLQSRDRGTTVSNPDIVRRKGVEVQADAFITPNWSATLAYTYLKSVTKSATGDIRNHLVPKHTLAAKTAYTFNGTALDGLTLGAGIRYVGKSVTQNGSFYSGHTVPSSTVVDLMARYQFNPQLALQLNVDNVGNRRYVAGCDYYCYYGASRNINATLNYKF